MTSKFIFKSTHVVAKKVEAFEMEVELEFNENCIANIGYGFNPHYYNCTAKDPGMPVERYRLHSAIKPHKGDTLTHVKSNRIFEVGVSEGFLLYTAPLLENNKAVAKITYEDYYKDWPLLNQVNLTLLAEAYICNNIVIIEEEEEVYEAAIDWFDQWKDKGKYNNWF